MIKDQPKEEKGFVVGGWIATPNNGTFLYKAKEQPTFSQPVKPVFKEKPQYKLIEEYETVAKQRYKEELYSTVKDIVIFLKTL